MKKKGIKNRLVVFQLLEVKGMDGKGPCKRFKQGRPEGEVFFLERKPKWLSHRVKCRVLMLGKSVEKCRLALEHIYMVFQY